MFRLLSPTRLAMVHVTTMLFIFTLHPRSTFAQAQQIPADQLPHFAPDGSLREPSDWETWVMVGASTGLSLLVLSFFEASRKSAPAKAGVYEGDRVPDIDIHVKRKGSNQTGWAFFGFSDGAAVGGKLPPSASCYSCHATEAAHDNVFTQFYPFMRARLATARH